MRRREKGITSSALISQEEHMHRRTARLRVTNTFVLDGATAKYLLQLCKYLFGWWKIVGDTPVKIGHGMRTKLGKD